MKKGVYLILAILFCLGLTVPVTASESGCSIALSLNVGDLPVTNGSFTLYRVGTKSSDGYRIQDRFGGGFVRDADALSPHLAQWMESAAGEGGVTMLLDVDGDAVFSDLEEGLYLMVQTELTDGFYPIQSFLLTLPSDGRRNLNVNLEPLPRVMAAPATGQDPAPYIGLAGMGLSAVGLIFCSGGLKRRK